ncbi:MAG TPA: AAA family ATPase [Geminicoccaceae bacterium]|nr:AAA family ATPase [Geminicoccaceae bacterium]
MIDLKEWLAGQGLGRHAAAFLEQGIGADVLPDLTDADLRELGLNLGDRKRLLKAIAALGPAPVAAGAPAPLAVPREAERRQLTVMFVDLVGSTALSSRLDPEEMREVIRAYQNAVAGEVTRFDGHVAKFMGDGVLAYFGWPTAHEDDAERAVRAGLAIVAAVANVGAAGEAAACRVGIATGLVVVGDLVGEGAAQEEAVVGETPNLAARLQQVAKPGAVVIAAGTRRLVGELFQLEDLGPLTLKGLASAQHCWRVLGAGSVEDRFAALHEAGTLVGRERELAVLLDHWRQAAAGAGRVVLLEGEAGIGKSRLVAALRETLRHAPVTVLRHQCSPHTVNSALWPIVEHLEHSLGPMREQPPDGRLDRLDALVKAAGGEPATASPVLAALLRLPTGARYPVLDLSPQQQKRRTFEVLINRYVGLSRRRPVLMVIEDVHWLDPTTKELLEALIERIVAVPILLVGTLRPGFDPPFAGCPGVTIVTLNRLERRAVEAIIHRIAGGKSLPAPVMKTIHERTDGVPLFVEELTKTVLDSALLEEEADTYTLRGPLPPLAVPSTLHDSLLARLDRLAPVKEIAQIGAAIGRQFSHELVTAVARRPEGEVRDALGRLVEAELVFRSGPPPRARYAFKHALVRDAAYESLLKSKRQQLHARIAVALEERFAEMAQRQPEVLAHHCTEAGLVDKAVEYWWRAGQLASQRSALEEAIGHFRAALDIIAELPETGQRAERELDLLIALGSALISAKGQAAAETGAVYARALELCRRVGGGPRLLPLLFGRWVFHLVRAEHAAAREIADELLRLARREGDATGWLVGHRAAGIGALWRGEPVEARGHLERALALYDPERHRPLAAAYGYDLRLAGLAGLAFALFQLGSPDQAMARCHQAVEEAERQAHPAGLAYALYHACMLDQIRRDAPGLAQRAAALAALAAEHGFALWRAAGAVFDGWLLAEEGRAAEGIARIEDGLVAYRATGAALFEPYFLALSATLHGAAGRTAEGQRLLARASGTVRARGERWLDAELHRLEGELLRSAGADPAEAGDCFNRALVVARTNSAKFWELRAATSLVRLLAEQGRRDEAHDLLAPLYGWFTEGFGTADLIEAKTLLEAQA